MKTENYNGDGGDLDDLGEYAQATKEDFLLQNVCNNQLFQVNENQIKSNMSNQSQLCQT